MSARITGGNRLSHGKETRIWVVPRKADAFRPKTDGRFFFRPAEGGIDFFMRKTGVWDKLREQTMEKRGHRLPLLGLGLFVLYALGLIFGIFWGDRVVWKFHLNNWIREPLPILMYHHVAKDGTKCNDMTVTISRLRWHFNYLKADGYTPILPRDLISGEPLPERPVLITFDDGYTSNYDMLYPLLREFGFHAVIAPIVCMPDRGEIGYCSWDMLREMQDSGLVEIASHTYALHNLDNHGMYREGGPNGIQRGAGETEEGFQIRVLDDLQKSYDRLTEELGTPPTCFAYPFGAKEPDAQDLIDELFPVSLITWPGTQDLYDGTRRMLRFTISMDTFLPDCVR